MAEQESRMTTATTPATPATTLATKPIRRKKPRRTTKGSVFGHAVMALGLLYFFTPLVWLVLASTKTNASLFDSFGFWFAAPFNLWQNISDVFTRDNGVYVIWLRNSAIYAITAAVASTFIAALAGYAFAIYDFRGRNLLFMMVIGSVFVPASVFAVPLFFMMSKAHLSNNLIAIILPALVNPFGVYLMRIYTDKAVPRELIDAARVDGAGEFRIFFQVAMRILSPGLVTVLLLAFVGAWNNYFLPLLLLSSQDTFPLTLGVTYWNSLAVQPGNVQVIYAIVVTASLIAIIPVTIAFLIVQRYWEGGLTVGGIKE
jgi:multiple sugar transport system permease protein